MAVTSLWRIKGWLGGVVLYIENPDKTNNPDYYKKADMSEKQKQELSDVIEYAVQTNKTTVSSDESLEVTQSFVSGINCAPSTARDEMMAVKKRFGKETGTIAYHGFQSFSTGEVTPELAHKIGVELANRLWGERYQVIVATHLDKESHLHNHFLINTVSFVDGMKYYRSKKDYYEMKTQSDNLCRQYGLSVIENPKPGHAMNYAEWKDNKEGKETWRGIIKKEVDMIISESLSEKHFFYLLQQHGFQYKVGKDISVRPPGKERFFRLARNLGDDYTLERIRERILSQKPVDKPKRQSYSPVRYSYRGNFKKVKKFTGFRALYIRYMFMIGAIPKHRTSVREINFIFKEDILKMREYSRQFQLLADIKIDTVGQLLSYQEDCRKKLEPLHGRRRKLYRQIKKSKDPTEYMQLKSTLSEVSQTIKYLKQQITLCDGISTRSTEMKEKMQKVKEIKLTKEDKSHVQQR